MAVVVVIEFVFGLNQLGEVKWVFLAPVPRNVNFYIIIIMQAKGETGRVATEFIQINPWQCLQK